MSEKEKHTLTGWLIGVATTVALALSAWCLHVNVTTSELAAVLKAKQELNFADHDGMKDSVKQLREENEKQHDAIRADQREIKSDIKLLLARK